jgi:hypothetical protein
MQVNSLQPVFATLLFCRGGTEPTLGYAQRFRAVKAKIIAWFEASGRVLQGALSTRSNTWTMRRNAPAVGIARRLSCSDSSEIIHWK